MLMQVKASSQSLELPQELLPHFQALDQSASQVQELSKRFPTQQLALAQSTSADLQQRLCSLQQLAQVSSFLQLLDMATSAAQLSTVAIE
jgi:hypothetical protein